CSILAVTAFGPGRNHRLLPALAKNMPLAYFLNASRPLHKGAFGLCAPKVRLLFLTSTAFLSL
ncbi:MAG: hypothetical protein IKL81_02040, partial [Clostridia bacterium]|nr:hypothetical protein [Clostridia bacterium]